MVRATTLKLLLIISLAISIRGGYTCNNLIVENIWNDAVENIEEYFENNCWNEKEPLHAYILNLDITYANPLPNSVFQSFYLQSVDINGSPYVKLTGTVAFLSIPKGSFGEFSVYKCTYPSDKYNQYLIFIKNNEYYTDLNPLKMIHIPDILQKPTFIDIFFYSLDETDQEFILFYIYNMQQYTYQGVSLKAPILSITSAGGSFYFFELYDGTVIESHIDYNQQHNVFYSKIMSPPPIVTYITKDVNVFKLNYRTYSVFYYFNSSTFSEQIPYGPDVYLCKELKYDPESSFAKYYENKTMVISYGNYRYRQYYKQYTSLPINYDYSSASEGLFFILYEDKVECYVFNSYIKHNDIHLNENLPYNIVLTTYVLDQADIGKFSVVKYYQADIILTSLDGKYTTKVLQNFNQYFQQMLYIEVDRQLLNQTKPTQMYFDYILHFGNEQQGNPIRFRLNNPYGSNHNPLSSGGMILNFHFNSFFQIMLIFITFSNIIRKLVQ
ncbi:hypothetical protein ABPG74_013981 [Tetrahymena malaccensis]